MRTEKVKVIIWGFGAMGSGMAKMILKKKGFEIVGICDTNPKLVGKSVQEVFQINTPGQRDVIISSDITKVVTPKCCDVVLLATDSFTKPSFDKIAFLAKQQVNIISTAEEMSYPLANQPELATKMDALAKEYGITILGTGVNPGMMMDLLVLFLSGVCEEVESIEVSRINSLSPFGHTVMEEQGVGLSIDEFNQMNEAGKISGHVGFRESMRMIADGLGWKISDFHQEMTPIITEVDRKSPFGFAAKDHVAGVDMRATGYVDGKPLLKMNHPQQIEPQLGNTETGDYVTIHGNPPIHMAIKPEVDGGVGTIAICVNMIPHVINATPGLKTMLDLPVPRAIEGDVRERIE